MEILLLRYSTIVSCFRQNQQILGVEELKQIFDDIVSYLNKISSNKKKTDGMHILTIICDELASLNAFRLFDNLILRNHPIFNCIGRTFEMLLTKSNHSQTISMIKQEEDCFSSTSYLIAQLCLYQNEPIELFYGKVSREIFPVTEKPNPRDECIVKTSRQSNELTEKPNLKTARLPPNAPVARPIELRQPDITKVSKLKKFSHQFISVSKETQIDQPVIQSNQTELPILKFQDIFLTKLFFDQLTRAIEDLSRNEYPSYHVKYKVIDRFVRLCSKLNIVDELLNPIIKCLCSKYYSDVFQTIQLDQIRLNPKQLFFIHECPQFLVQHDFLQQEKIVDLLCQTIIDATNLMLLYNMAYEIQIFSILKQKDLHSICLQLEDAKDNTIRFASMTLSTILEQETINENNEPTKLKEAYIQFLESIIIKSEQITTTIAARNIREKDNAKHVFVRGPFLEKLIRDIDHLSKHGYQPNEQRYKDAAQQIRVCTTEETNEVESLLDPIIACLSSKFYRNVYEKIIINQFKISKSNLAAKHLFFMRDCPEFLIRHDYKRQDEVATLLCTDMLKHAEFIFEQNLPNPTENEGEEETRNAHIEALLYHIKLLNHFALTPSTRKNFLTTTIIDEILQLLENETLVQITGRIVDVKNKMIQFTSQALIVRLDSRKVDEIVDPQSLTKFCIEYMEKSVREPRQSYQGIRLNSILRILETLLTNDLVQKTIVEEKEGILFLTKFSCIICQDNPTSDTIRKIRVTALKIIWKLLSVAPALSKKLKLNDLFIDYLLTFISKASQKEKILPSSIIWKLGDEGTLRLEQAGKKKQLEQEDHTENNDTAIDDQYNPIDLLDDSVSFDLMMSFSDDSSDISLCRKICNRLKKKMFNVYFEQQGKHRLESMKKAVLEKKIFLACLSAKYRISKVCMAEIEYASKNGYPIIPVIVEKNYKVKGWLNHLIGKRKVIDFKQEIFDDALLNLTIEINKIKTSD
ncbi:unnamed protein product [Rotaria sp. Silwood2]|nr:unnamed protein product [Rotaria sp. Silwood2]